MPAKLDEYYPPFVRPYSSQWTDAGGGRGAARCARRAAQRTFLERTSELGMLGEELPAVGAWQRRLAVVPVLPNGVALLRWSVLPVLLFSFMLPSLSPSTSMVMNFLSGLVSAVPWLGIAAGNGLDPVLLHAVVGVIFILLCMQLGRQTGASRTEAGAIGVTILTLAMIVEYLFDLFLMKPSIGVQRPTSFTTTNEPFLTRIVHDTLGAGGDFPSGSVARQMVLACLVTWMCSYRLLDIHPAVKIAALGISWLLVPVVAMLRVYVGAHTVEAVLVGMAAGLLTFWFVAVVFGSVFYEEIRALLPELARFWVLGTAGWFIFAPHKITVGIMIIAVVVGAGGWAKVVQEFAPRLEARMFPNSAVRLAWACYKVIRARSGRQNGWPFRGPEWKHWSAPRHHSVAHNN